MDSINSQKIKEKAVVFVDFEHWYFSSRNLYDVSPDIEEWFKTIKLEFNIQEMFFFADFANKCFKPIIGEIKKVGGTLVQTRDKKVFLKKEMTDFVMLDYIYRMSVHPNSPDTYIIFSGDGHFQSVVKYLTQIQKKRVIVYGVISAFSKLLKKYASEIREMPCSEEEIMMCAKLIINNMAYAAEHPGIFPTFTNVEKIVALRNNLARDKVKITLNWLIGRGYIYKRTEYVEFNKQILVLSVNWELARADGLYIS